MKNLKLFIVILSIFFTISCVEHNEKNMEDTQKLQSLIKRSGPRHDRGLTGVYYKCIHCKALTEHPYYGGGCDVRYSPDGQHSWKIKYIRR